MNFDSSNRVLFMVELYLSELDDKTIIHNLNARLLNYGICIKLSFRTTTQYANFQHFTILKKKNERKLCFLC
jgi:hypothetical protein